MLNCTYAVLLGKKKLQKPHLWEKITANSSMIVYISRRKETRNSHFRGVPLHAQRSDPSLIPHIIVNGKIVY